MVDTIQYGPTRYKWKQTLQLKNKGDFKLTYNTTCKLFPIQLSTYINHKAKNVQLANVMKS